MKKILIILFCYFVLPTVILAQSTEKKKYQVIYTDTLQRNHSTGTGVILMHAPVKVDSGLILGSGVQINSFGLMATKDTAYKAQSTLDSLYAIRRDGGSLGSGSVDVDYVAVSGNAESVNGYYKQWEAGFTASASYKSKKFAVDPLKAYCVTSVVSGSSTALAVYYTSAGVLISAERIGNNVYNISYNRQILSIPPTADSVGLTCYAAYPFTDSYALLFEIRNASTGTPESEAGYYSSSTGVFVTNSSYLSMKFTVDQTKDYYVTTLLSGSATALASYYDGVTYISSEVVGDNGASNITQYTYKKLLSIPTNATIVGLTTLKVTSVIAGYPILISSPSNKRMENVISDYNYLKWKGKNILILGTSISTSSFGVPEETGKRIGATIYNEAVGSSTVRASLSTGSMVGMEYTSCLRALTHTLAEKQSLMDYWTTGLNSAGVITGGGTYGWRDLLIGSPPAAYTTYASAVQILAWSFQSCLVAKYLNTSSATFVCSPDLILIEHGYNDLVSTQYDASDESAIDPTGTDRSTYGGAMNFLIDTILTYNPRARIALIGHYTGDMTEIVSASRVYDCGSIAAGTDSTFSITCSGAIAGSPVTVGASVAADAGLIITGECTSANTITVRLSNHFLVNAIDPASRTYHAVVQNTSSSWQKRVVRAQQNLANHWNFPLLKTWEKTGWNENSITMAGYWEDSKNWINSGGAPQALSTKQIWLYDGIHPYSNTTRDYLATLWIEFLKGL
jgi:hypothetical protein